MNEVASTTSARRCVFCHREGGLTKEHVYPQWIWREYGDGNKPPLIVDPGPSRHYETLWFGQEGVEQFDIPANAKPIVHATGRVVRAVCSDCNTGWMSALEREFISSIRKLTSRRTWRPKIEEVQVLQRWAVKTALMLECAEPEIALAPPDVYDAVYRGVGPPGSWYFGIARATAENAFDLMACPVVSSFSSPGSFHGGGQGEMFGSEYLILIARVLVIVRYSPHEVRAPARLDHDLVKHPSGRPITFDETAVGKPLKFRDLPVINADQLDGLLYWGHATDPRRGGLILLASDGERWVGHLGTARYEDLVGVLDVLKGKGKPSAPS